MSDKKMIKSIITVIGKDHVGIIAKVTGYLAENDINILDLDQSIIAGYFHMAMVVESAELLKSFPEMSSELSKIGEDIGVEIRIQHAEIFEMMHRI